jgi:hypothetical protein
MLIVGIDPGKSGGVAICSPEAGEKVFPMPETEGDIVDLFTSTLAMRRSGEDCVVYMEALTGFAGVAVPSSTMFTMAKYYWSWLFLFMYAGIPVNLVTPGNWQKALNLGTKGSKKGLNQTQKSKIDRDWKNKLKSEAQRIYPYVEGVTLKTCDALLIMQYGRDKQRNG